MNDIKIEKGIPLPKPRARYPFAQMEVGDSIEVDERGVTAAAHHGRHFSKKFSARKLRPNLYRIWRIE